MTERRDKKTAPWETLGGSMLLALALAGCSPYSSFCAEANECVGGNDADEDACNANLEALADQVSAYECDAEFDEFMTCAEEKFDCDDDHIRLDDCRDESEKVDKCVDKASGD